MEVYKKINWDSDFFQIPVYELDIRESSFDQSTLTILENCEAEVVYIRIKKEQISELQTYFTKNIFLDHQVQFKKSLFDFDVNKKSQFIVEELGYLTEELEHLIFLSGRFSRFFLDKNFGEKKAKELYLKWANEAINNEQNRLYVIKLNEEYAGFVTLHLKEIDKNIEASIGLIAVSENFQRKGIAGQLLEACYKYLISRNIYSIRIKTQNSNYPAISCYLSHGFIIENEYFICHYWREK